MKCRNIARVLPRAINFANRRGRCPEMIYGWILKQIEFFGAADGSPAIVDPQLGVNVLGVGPHGAQRQHAFTGNFRAA